MRIRSYIFVFYFLTSIQLNAQDGDSLIAKLAAAKEDTNKVKLLNRLASIYISKDLLKAQKYANESFALSDNINFTKGKASAACIRGVVYLEQGKTDSAETNFIISELLFKKLNNLSGQASVLSQRSGIYVMKGEYDKALDLHEKSLKIYSQLNDRENQAIVLSDIAMVYSYMRQFNISEGYYLKALEIKKELKDERGESIVYMNLGSDSYDNKKFQKALGYINSALALQVKLGDKRLIIINKTNRGNVYTKLKQFDLAIIDLEECLNENSRSGDTLQIINSLTSIGDVYNNLGKFKEAEVKFKSADSLIRDTLNLKTKRTIYLGLTDAYIGMKEYIKAHDYFKKAYLLEERIFNNNLADKISKLKETFEAERRDKEIGILKEKESNLQLLAEKRKLNVYIAVIGILLVLIILFLVIIISKFKRDKLKLETSKNKAIFEQKALRAQMNPHFIFNSLNSIQKYILQDQSQEAYDYLAKFSKLIRQVLMNSERSDITLKDEIDLLKLYVELEQRRFKNRFDYSINYSDKVPLDFKLPIMLVQPFVENAIWHGLMNLDKSKHGLLAIDFELGQDSLKIQIKDNGVGREAAALKRKDSEYRSVGMMFTQKRLELLKESGNVNAKVEIIDLKDEDGKANGTLVEIKLPLIILNGD